MKLGKWNKINAPNALPTWENRKKGLIVSLQSMPDPSRASFSGMKNKPQKWRVAVKKTKGIWENTIETKNFKYKKSAVRYAKKKMREIDRKRKYSSKRRSRSPVGTAQNEINKIKDMF